MTDLKSIVEEHINIRKELKLTKLDDNTLFSEAVRRFNTIGMGERPSGGSSAPGKSFKDLNAPATDKQISYLKKLGVTIPAGLTKEDAKVLISETVANKKKGGDGKVEGEESDESYY